MKFKNYIETESGIKDTSTSPGAAGQVLSSTVTGTSWIDQGEIIAAAATVVVIECKNTHTTSLTKGTPVYQTGTVGATDVIEIAPGNALISTGAQPSIGLLQQDLAINEFGYVIITGELLNITTDPIDGLTPVTGQKIFVKSGGGLTLTKPTTELNSIQNMGLVGKVSGGNAGSITVSSIMRTNDVPNLPTGRIWIGDGNTVVSDKVYVDEPNGRVGIGTTTPLGAIQIGDGAAASPSTNQILVLSNTATTGGNSNLYLATGASGTSTIGMGSTQFSPTNTAGKITYTDSSDTFSFDTNFSTKMVINSSGNVGIGTTNPSYKLDVSGDAYIDETLNIETTISGTLIYGYGGVGAGNLVVGGLNFASFTPGVITLVNQDTTISAGQDLGVLQFGGKDDQTNGYANGQIICTTAVGAGSGNTGGGIFRFLLSGNTTGSGPTERMRITNNGDVGIGTTSPSSKLQVNGGVQLANDTASPSAAKVGTFRYYTSGNNSYVDMCMQTGASTYTWVNIVTNSW